MDCPAFDKDSGCGRQHDAAPLSALCLHFSDDGREKKALTRARTARHEHVVALERLLLQLQLLR
jgi:hypothetical protein